MADISIVLDEASDDCDEGVFEQGDGSPVVQRSPCPISPLDQIRICASSDTVYGRQRVPQVLKEIFKEAPVNILANELPDIMSIFTQRTNDGDLSVRCCILEDIPSLALAALDCEDQVPELTTIVQDYFLPIVIHNLGDSEALVRKATQTSLFVLIENGLITREQVETQICPTILQLSNVKLLKDYHTGTITLMSKLAPLLGSEITERALLLRFTELCSNKLFYVRRVCAFHIGDFCAVVGTEAFEQMLLPCYLTLCVDNVWEVRQACAEVATCVSFACPPGLRYSVLAPVFVKLLEDEIRFARVSAFRTLGTFISTFADPPIVNMKYNNLGHLVVVTNDGTEFRINSDSFLVMGDLIGYYEPETGKRLDTIENRKRLDYLKNNEEENQEEEVLFPEYYVDSEEYTKNLCAELLDTDIADDVNADSWLCSYFVNEVIVSDSSVLNTKNVMSDSNSGNHLTNCDTNSSCDNTHETLSTIGDTCNVDLFKNEQSNDTIENSTSVNVDRNLVVPSENHCGSEEYNSFNYWYISPELPLDEVIVSLQLRNLDSSEKRTDEDYVKEHSGLLLSTDLDDTVSSNSSPEQCDRKLNLTQDIEPVQYIVPQELINHFASMADPNLADTTDKDLAYLCAYSLPAVALTLGRNNWHLLQKTVESLAENIDYKVRKTVANGLHELANILGSEMATTKLTPFFEEFIMDLDEVRIGILEHLPHFLGLINQSKRNVYLPKLAEFLPSKISTRSNWRFRKELAEQLFYIVTLFRPSDASKYIGNIAQELLCDKIAAVRESAILLVTELVRYVSHERKLTSHLFVKLAEKFAHSTNWKRRQTFCLLCTKLLTVYDLDLEQFASDVMPHLLDLSWDPVPNVRLVVSRAISQEIATNSYFFDINSQHYDSIHSVLRRLQSDKDRDVRNSALITRFSTIP